MIDIKELSESDLKRKIEAIKAEREKTADALKRYEEELERRKQEVPLGVPAEGNFCVNFNNTIANFSNKHGFEEMSYNIFNTVESAEKHAKMLLEWRKALVANAKGEPIDIKVLLPLLPKGWVAMDKNGDWYWYNEKPELFSDDWHGSCALKHECLYPFNIKPAEDWRNSLVECGI